jgi:hypothetical protein
MKILEAWFITKIEFMFPQLKGNYNVFLFKFLKIHFKKYDVYTIVLLFILFSKGIIKK